MPNLNRVQLMGNLTRTPEVKILSSGTPVCEFGLAINRVYRTDAGEKREETTFIDISFFGKQAETLAEYTQKGHPLYVEGRLKLEQWEDKETGNKRSKLKVIGESFQFLKSKSASDGDEDERPRQRPTGKTSATFKKPPKPPIDPDLDEFAEDEPPF